MRARRILIACGLAVVLGVSPAAGADGVRDRATALVKEGARKYQGHDYAGALDDFQRAYGIYPTPRIEFDVAQCLHRLGRADEAATGYQAYLDDAVADPALDPQSQAAARQALQELDGRVFRVVVATTPEDAEVDLDGHPLRARRAFVLRGTQHQLGVHAPGYLAQAVALKEPATGPLRLAVALRRSSAASSLAAPGDLGPGPAGALASPSPLPTPSHTASWVAWGIGGAFALGGAIAGVVAAQTSSDITKRDHRCPSVASDDLACGTWLDEAHTADALWAGALVAAATGGVLWWTAGPGPSPGSTGVAVGGRF